MGSLPNLHELSGEQEIPPVYRPGPALGHLCGGNNPTLSQEEKTKILHRYSGHNRMAKTRSNPQDTSRHVYDENQEHMAAYSPVFSRSTRNLNHTIRRRDSINSSIGATSVRRLIATVVRGGANAKSTPVYTRRTLIRNLVLICISNLLLTATYLPFLALQTSVSVWTLPLKNELVPININIGSLLLSLVYLSAAISSLFGPSVVQNLGSNCVIIISLITFTLFYISHLYPVLYVLLPASIVLGLSIGPFASACIIYLMTLAAKITYIYPEEDEETKQLRRVCIIRRVARAFRASHDFGLILGSIVSALLITYTINVNYSEFSGDYGDNNTVLSVSDGTALLCTNSSMTSVTNCTKQAQESNIYDYNAFLDEIFDTFEGARVCGAQACPSKFLLTFNMSDESFYHVLPKRSASALASSYVGTCIVAVLLTILFLDRIKMYVYQDPLERSEGLTALRAVKEAFRDTKLQMAAPLAVFIGFEQAFIYADFSKSYVVCTLGIHRLNLVFLSMGLLQSIAACTLSMLLRTIRRYYVVAVGFAFHACLIMVLMLWKPIEDDPALFYVISASWGVCNAIWEMLNFTLLTGLYSDNYESAFANATFFKFTGLTIAFGVHGFLCNYIKLYALAFALTLSVVPFAWLEFKLESMRKVKNITRL